MYKIKGYRYSLLKEKQTILCRLPLLAQDHRGIKVPLSELFVPEIIFRYLYDFLKFYLFFVNSKKWLIHSTYNDLNLERPKSFNCSPYPRGLPKSNPRGIAISTTAIKIGVFTFNDRFQHIFWSQMIYLLIVWVF